MNGAITQRESATAVTPEFFLCVVVDFFLFFGRPGGPSFLNFSLKPSDFFLNPSEKSFFSF